MIIRKIATEAKPLIKIIKKEVGQLTTTPIRVTPKAQAPKSHITIKPRAVQTFEDGTGANIIAEQNKARITIRAKSTQDTPINSQNHHNICVLGRTGPINTTYLKYSRLLNEGTMTLQKAEELANEFYKDTGLVLHCPSIQNVGAFDTTLVAISEAVHKGTFPKEIKHIVIGHGVGNSLVPHSWEMSGPSLTDGKIVNIYEYINNIVKNKGEKVLVCCCETANKGIEGKPGIGYGVDLSLTSTGGLLGHDIYGPAKVVRVGENKICGHYTVPEGLVLYE